MAFSLPATLPQAAALVKDKADGLEMR